MNWGRSVGSKDDELNTVSYDWGVAWGVGLIQKQYIIKAMTHRMGLHVLLV